MIELNGITKSFGTEVVQTVLQNIDFKIDVGKIHTIMGPSGSGKTTLLKILGTLLVPDAGEYTFNEILPFALKEPDLAQFRNEKIGFIFQNHHLLQQCTILENILLPTLPQKKSALHLERAKELMLFLEIEHLAQKFPHQISGGESQRTAIARALINYPDLILADEPTGALDQQLSKSFGELLLKINHEFGLTMVVVTHSPELSAQLGNIFQLVKSRLIQAK